MRTPSRSETKDAVERPREVDREAPDVLEIDRQSVVTVPSRSASAVLQEVAELEPDVVARGVEPGEIALLEELLPGRVVVDRRVETDAIFPEWEAGADAELTRVARGRPGREKTRVP